MCSSEENSFFFPIPIRFFNTQLKRKIGNFFSFNRERSTTRWCCRHSDDDDVDLDDESDDDDDENNHHHRFFFFFLARAKPRVSLRVVSRARRTDCSSFVASLERDDNNNNNTLAAARRL